MGALSAAGRAPSGSLFQQLVVFAVAMIAATAVALGGLFFAHARRQARRELVERGGLLAENLALNARRGIETGNVFRTLEPLVASAAAQPDVAVVRVLDARGAELAGSARPAGETIAVAAEVRSSLEMLGAPGTAGDRAIGRVEVRLSMEGFHRRLRRTGTLFLAAMAAVTALGAAAALAFGRRLSATLAVMTEAAARLRRGEHGVMVPVPSQGELGELAESFNAMSRELSETTGCLEEVVESLLTAVVVAGADGRIRRVNRAACGMTGFEPADLAGKPLGVVFDAEGSPVAPEPMERLLREGGLRDQAAFLRLKAGGKFAVRLAASLVKDGDGMPYAVVLLARTGLEE